MSGGVVLARVSLNEKLLAVTDHRGVIVLVSEDASWALGLAGPASSFVGSSLLDHLTDEDKNEYKNAMRRRSGSLLRLRHQGCFVWLDISHHPRVTPRLKRALHRVERTRAGCSCCEKPQRHANFYNHKHGHARTDNEFHKQQQQGEDIGLHVLSKERPLDWFLEPAVGEELLEDEEGSLAAAAADSLENMSLHTSESSSSAGSGATGELLAWDDEVDQQQQAAHHHHQQQQQQEQEAAAASAAYMYKEYSFRDIFEYALGGGRASTGGAGGGSRQGSRASNLNLATEAAASGSAASFGAHARAVAAVVLKAGQHKRTGAGAGGSHTSRVDRVAAKCRAAPEGSPSVYTYSSSWRSVGGYMAQRAAATVGLSAGGSVPAQQGGDDGGWGLFVDLDLVA